MTYEYIKEENLSIEEINELAQEGWELVAAVNSFFVKVPVFYFKRPYK
jgi:hypothetical protein